MVSLAQLAALTGLSQYKLKRCIKSGQLEALNISGKYQIAEGEVDRFRMQVLLDSSAHYIIPPNQEEEF